MTERIAGRRPARAWALAALLSCVVLVAAGCGNDDDAEAGTSPDEAKALAAKYPEEGVLPGLCKLLTKKEFADATGKEVGDVHEFPTMCAYYTPDGKGLVGSVLAQRPGIVDYDDLEHTRTAEKQDGIEGADRAVFLAPYHISAALKADIYLHVQVSGMRDDSDAKVKKASRDLLEKALARL